MANPPPAPARRGWPAWGVTWLAVLGPSLAGVVLLAALSREGASGALEGALADHLGSSAGLADAVLRDVPVETLAALGGEASRDALARRIDALADAGGLRALALLDPGDGVYGHGSAWVPLAAERDLVARARAGEEVAGPLYRDAAGEMYQTVYRPLTGHTGWVVAAEARGATLGAMGTLARAQVAAGVAVVALAVVASMAVAAALSRPIRRLRDDLAAASPGASPEAVGEQGYREVREVAGAARGLLGAIEARDAALQAAHHREVDQLTRMAAGLAHEVGNPLNAIQLSVERLATLDDADRRAAVVERVRGQLAELGGIVERLRDLTRPLRPQVEAVRVGDVVDAAMADAALSGAALGAAGVRVEREGDADVRTDPVLLAQIVRNLVLNATQAGATAVRVVVTADPVTVAVTDDGPGIDPADAERIFAWFHTTRAAGSGLGLPVSRRIAGALGGMLELRAVRPATFVLTLPPEAPCSP